MADPARPYSIEFEPVVSSMPKKKSSSKKSSNKPLSKQVSVVKIKPFKVPEEKRQTKQHILLSMTPTAQYEEIMRLKSLTHLLQLDLKSSKQEITTLRHITTRQEKALSTASVTQNEYPSHLQSLLTEIQTLQIRVKSLKEANHVLRLEESGFEQGKSRLQADLTNAIRKINEHETPASLPCLIENLKGANKLIGALTERIQKGAAKIHEKNQEILKLKLRVELSAREAMDARDKLDDALMKLQDAQNEMVVERNENRKEIKDQNPVHIIAKHTSPSNTTGHSKLTNETLKPSNLPQIKKPTLIQAFDSIRKEVVFATIEEERTDKPSVMRASQDASPTIFKPTLFKKNA